MNRGKFLGHGRTPFNDNPRSRPPPAPHCSCVYRKLKPGHRVVMESAEDGERFDASGPMNRTRVTGASLANDRCVLMSLQ